MKRLFVAYKPPFVSSFVFLKFLKKKYKAKKGGFSGILDPFARGLLVIAFGEYTKLFNFFKKAPKKYIATIWLGATSVSMDVENIVRISSVLPLKISLIKKEIENLIGEIKYTPPIFSAKKIKGKKAYEFARENKQVLLTPIKSKIYSAKLINYSHPFLTFEIEVSEGAYIRSIAKILTERLKTEGTLCSLERTKEGEFVFENENKLNPIMYLNTAENKIDFTKKELLNGKKISIKNLEKKEENIYHILKDNFLTIIKIENKKVSYLLNCIEIEEVSKNFPFRPNIAYKPKECKI
jgi:tRNA pseudouridine55 synthase